MTPRRGRPRAYDPERALDRATGTFWRGGLTGTSLDDLTASTAMNRPSLYAAFGDKQGLYLQTLERYKDAVCAAIDGELAIDRPLSASLEVIFGRALDLYRAGQPAARGCYLTGTAVAAAGDDAVVRGALNAAIAAFDRAFTAGFARAQEAGALPRTSTAADLGAIAMGMMHTLSVRARAGATRAQLEAMVRAAIAMLCAGER